MSLAQLQKALPKPLRKHLDPASPMPVRMMAAKGLVPLAPKEMVIILAGLSKDEDEILSNAAKEELQKLPDRIIDAALKAKLPPAALEAIAAIILGKDDLLELLVLDRDTPDIAIANLASNCSESIAELIAQDQIRLLRSEDIVRNVRENSSLMRSTLDRLFDFLVREGVFYEGIPEFAESFARLSPDEMEALADNILAGGGSGDSLPAEAKELMERAADFEGGEWVEFPAKLRYGGGVSNKRFSLHSVISSLNVAQKVALAIKGNREAREILVRDTNKIVATAAIKSPRITDREVVNAAQSRAVCQDVIRIIAGSKQMVRSYQVKCALVFNPKTPIPIARSFLRYMNNADIKALARSRNISSVITKTAQQLLERKLGGR